MTEKWIRKIWMTGNGSSTLVIPKELAYQKGLMPYPTYCTIEKTKEGLLIKKLNVPGVQ